MMEEDLLEQKDVFTPEEVRLLLDVGLSTAYRYLSQGRIRSVRVRGKILVPKKYLLEYWQAKDHKVLEGKV